MPKQNAPKISTGTFWFWNSTPTQAGIRRQLKDIADAGYSCVYIHPMPDSFHKHNFFCGMKCSYLGKKYFSLLKYAFRESQKLGLTFMLYDEGGWPSGNVLDRLVKRHPECCTRAFVSKEDGSIVEEILPFPDQFRPESTRYFIEMVHELYKKELGDEFGKSIRGIFTDEPFTKFNPEYICVVNDLIIERLRKDHGMDFYQDILPWFGFGKGVSREGDTARRIYFSVCSKLFAENYCAQLARWCRKNHLELEGHFSGEDVHLSLGMIGNLLRVLTPLHVPGVDTIWRQIFPGQPYQFFPRFALSAAIRSGRSQTLCESFNVYTYALSAREMNFAANALLVQGINRILTMPFMYKDTGKHKICCSTDISPRTPAYDAMKTLNEFWDFAGDFNAGALEADVWVFAQIGYLGNGPVKEIHAEQDRYNEKLIALGDKLDKNCVFWRFADEDDKDSARLPEMVIVPLPEKLMPEQLPALDTWRQKGVKVVMGMDNIDVKPYSTVEPGEKNQCRILPCIRPEGKALMIFNSSESDTVFEFSSAGKNYALLDKSCSGEIYPLTAKDGKWQLPMAPHSLRIIVENGCQSSPKHFDRRKIELQWQIKKVEQLRFSLNGKSRYEKRQINAPLPAGGNFCESEKDFSGRIYLESELISEYSGKAYIQFEKISFSASLKVNGTDCGTAAFAPFIFEVKLKKGINKLQMKISGTAGNEFRRCFREELEPAGYFNTYASRFKLYTIEDDCCGLSGPTTLIIQK